MDEKDIAVRIIDLKKRYRLGVIGGGTLQGDIQSWLARKRGKEDPNAKLGVKATYGNETFLALDGINLTIRKGERLGILGHNGAGKSTLLKIFSRVTAPTEGKIYIDGRVSSMLEVGTGFHEELTGRENIYLNGAILGMTRAEVDSKIDEIIEFSECAKFIDTPVKRYSSGMYVKLAFAVAAHLDADILVMDEVLAVGDMKFQQKCLGKMSDVSQEEGKTVLYVSHNVNTIRKLCTRCIVLDHGKLIYDGEVEPAIALYADTSLGDKSSHLDLREAKRYRWVATVRNMSFTSISFPDKEINDFSDSETIRTQVEINSDIDLPEAKLRIGLYDSYDRSVASSFCPNIGAIRKGDNTVQLNMKFKGLAPGSYRAQMVVFSSNEFGTVKEHDNIEEAFFFDLTTESNEFEWNALRWSSVRLPDMEKTQF